MNPVHDAEQNGGKYEDECKDRSVPCRQDKVFPLKNNRDQKKYQCTNNQADGHMRDRRMKRFLETKFRQHGIEVIDH